VVFTDDQGQIRYTLMPNGMIKIGSAITIRGVITIPVIHKQVPDREAAPEPLLTTICPMAIWWLLTDNWEDR
jgi:hypothetical protein